MATKKTPAKKAAKKVVKKTAVKKTTAAKAPAKPRAPRKPKGAVQVTEVNAAVDSSTGFTADELAAAVEPTVVANDADGLIWSDGTRTTYDSLPETKVGLWDRFVGWLKR